MSGGDRAVAGLALFEGAGLSRRSLVSLVIAPMLTIFAGMLVCDALVPHRFCDGLPGYGCSSGLDRALRGLVRNAIARFLDGARHPGRLV